MHSIITRSGFENTLYKLLLLGPKIEEFPYLVHKLSGILTALQYKPHWKMGVKNIQAAAYIGTHTVVLSQKLFIYWNYNSVES